jgi:hypothetical protein
MKQHARSGRARSERPGRTAAAADVAAVRSAPTAQPAFGRDAVQRRRIDTGFGPPRRSGPGGSDVRAHSRPPRVAWAMPAALRSVAQLADLPPDSIGALEDMKVQMPGPQPQADAPQGVQPQGEQALGPAETEITAKDLQIRLIQRLSEVGEAGFGYRLTALAWDGKSFTPTAEFDNEKHGMNPWPVSIDPFLGDLVPLVQATLVAAGQLKYLTDNFGKIQPTHDVVVDVDWYRERTQSDVGFHKDSRGTTLFVNLTYDNDRPMQGASTKDDLEGQTALEQKLPAEVRRDLDERRQGYDRNEEQRGRLREGEVPAYARLSFADPSVWHSTPLLRHRMEHLNPAPPDSAEQLESYLVSVGREAHEYRGLAAYWQAKDYEDDAIFDYVKQTQAPDDEVDFDDTLDLQTNLRALGLEEVAITGYQGDYTPQEFWQEVSDQGVTDKYNMHGISKEIQPQRGEELTAEVKRHRRRLSMALDQDKDLQGRLDEEAKRPRTFIRTWVRLVPR